ncbi:MAG: 50S ribosomal protein L5 [Planctomycetota bacterium]
MVRLRERYREEIVPALMEELGEKNRYAVPRVEKIVVSMGLGKALQDPKRMEAATKDIALITGQKPLVTQARKSVSAFKVRMGVKVGLKVTLRRKRMYEFLDRLISIVLPRVRDFRGLSPDAFDPHGNYSLGLTDQLVFPEISVDQVEFQQGMNITIVIRSTSTDASRRLLAHFGMPFRTQ